MSGSRMMLIGRRIGGAGGAVLLLGAMLWTSGPAAAHYRNHRDHIDSRSSLDLSSVQGRWFKDPEVSKALAEEEPKRRMAEIPFEAFLPVA